MSTNDNLNAWLTLLSPETNTKLQTLMNRIQQARTMFGCTIYPPQTDILNALRRTNPDTLKAVIVGQDPYHEEGQAMGLAFSVPNGVPIPPSLQNILQELQNDIQCHKPSSGNLTPWTQEGVLLLNTVLTVPAHRANGHRDFGWQDVTTAILQACLNLPQPIVFLLWGKQALTTLQNCDGSKAVRKFALTSTHPSPLSASRPAGNTQAFLSSHPFSRTNQILENNGVNPIHWELP